LIKRKQTYVKCREIRFILRYTWLFKKNNENTKDRNIYISLKNELVE